MLFRYSIVRMPISSDLSAGRYYPPILERTDVDLTVSRAPQLKNIDSR